MLRTVLVLLGNRSFSSAFLSFFSIFFPRINRTCNYWVLPIPICSIGGFYKVTLSRTWGLIVMLKLSEENLNHVLKTDGVNLLIDLLTCKMFSKHILSGNFKIEFCLNRGLVWKFLGWKLMILTAFFCKIIIRWIVLKFLAQIREQ